MLRGDALEASNALPTPEPEDGAGAARHLRLAEETPRRRRATPDEIKARRERVRARWAEGADQEQIADEEDVAQTTISRDLAALGLSPGKGRRPTCPKPEPRTCELDRCGRVFTPSSRDVARGFGRFCSPEHAYESWRVPGLERTCAREGCGVAFRPTPRQVRLGNGHYCSPECANEAHRVHPVPAARSCARAECGREFVPQSRQAADGRGRFCSHACAASVILTRWWKLGEGAARVVLETGGFSPFGTWSSRTRQKWVGRWSGKLGGRPTARTIDHSYEEKAAEVIRLRKLNARLGERALAERAGLSRRQVRAILSDPSAS